MKARMVVIGGIVAAVAGSILATAASAQSLADIARKEEERRKAMGKATATKQGKVYTNDNLNPDFTVPVPPAPPPPAAGASGATGAATDKTAKPAEAGSEATGGNPDIKPININDRGEKYWRDRSAALRGAMDGARARINAMQGRMTLVGNDPSEAQVTRKLLESAQAELASLQTEWDNFEALAKQQNVPDAWIR